MALASNATKVPALVLYGALQSAVLLSLTWGSQCPVHSLAQPSVPPLELLPHLQAAVIL